MFSVDLSTRRSGGALEFIDANGVAALARGRKHTRHAG
jgi:hypothetical protein